MKTLLRLLVLIVVVVGWSLAALSLHVVRAQNDRILLIPKQRLGITDTYVDARTWTLEEAGNHPELIERLIQSGKADELAYVVGDDHGNVAAALDEAVKNAPPATKPNSLRNFKSAATNHAKSAGWWIFGN